MVARRVIENAIAKEGSSESASLINKNNHSKHPNQDSILT